MDSRNVTRLVGGVAAAAIVAAGLVTAVPYISAAQDQPQTQTDQHQDQNCFKRHFSGIHLVIRRTKIVILRSGQSLAVEMGVILDFL